MRTPSRYINLVGIAVILMAGLQACAGSAEPDSAEEPFIPAPAEPTVSLGLEIITTTVPELEPTAEADNVGQAAPTPSVGQLIGDAFASMEAGQILYNPASTMTAGRAERVEVRITQDMSEQMTEALQEGLEGSGAPNIEELPVSPFMTASLRGDGFQIDALSSEEQLVLADGFTEWIWNVTPLASGERTLVLLVSARVKVPGFSDEQKDLEILERQISVEVDPVYSVRSFLRDNGGWLYPTLLPMLVAALGWAYRRRSRARTAEELPEDSRD